VPPFEAFGRPRSSTSGVDAFQGRVECPALAATGLLKALKPPWDARKSVVGRVMGDTVSELRPRDWRLCCSGSSPGVAEPRYPATSDFRSDSRPRIGRQTHLMPRPRCCICGSDEGATAASPATEGTIFGTEGESDAASPGATDGPNLLSSTHRCFARLTGTRLTGNRGPGLGRSSPCYSAAAGSSGPWRRSRPRRMAAMNLERLASSVLRISSA
jgi:hypothetical protein